MLSMLMYIIASVAFWQVENVLAAVFAKSMTHSSSSASLCLQCAFQYLSTLHGQENNKMYDLSILI